MRRLSHCADQHFGNLTNIRPMYGTCRSSKALHSSVIEIMKTLLARSNWHKMNGHVNTGMRVTLQEGAAQLTAGYGMRNPLKMLHRLCTAAQRPHGVRQALTVYHTLNMATSCMCVPKYTASHSECSSGL